MRLRACRTKVAILIAKMLNILADMEEELNNFMPQNIMRNDKHINMSAYFKHGNLQGTALDHDCPYSLSDKTI